MSRYTRIVLDGNNMAHRFRHTLKDLTSPTGDPVGVLYGMLNAVSNLAKEFSPDEVCVAWDSATSWRSTFDKGYKAARKAARKGFDPAEKMRYEMFIYKELPMVQQVFARLGIPQLCRRGLEADDVIAVLASDEVPDCVATTVVSSDCDLLQLVTHRVCVFQPTNNRLWTLGDDGLLQCNAEVAAKGDTVMASGLSPKRYLWMRAVVGDPSDSIAGVGGVGPITIAKLFCAEPLPKQTFDSYYEMMLEQASVSGRFPKLVPTLQSAPIKNRVTRNLRLMDLKFDHAILPKLKNHRSAILNEFGQHDLDIKAGTYGTWLTNGIRGTTLTPNAHFLNYFKGLNFSFAKSPVNAYEALAPFLALAGRKSLMHAHLSTLNL